MTRVRAIALVDLDDTLFQSLRKCPPGIARESLAPLGYSRDGEPIGFATPSQSAFLAWLAETTLLVPVTARGRDGIERVRIGWSAAICAHGGVILDGDRAVDKNWAARIAAAAASCREDLAGLAASVEREAAGAPLSVRILEEGGVGLYLLVKHRQSDAAALDSVIGRVAPGLPAGWSLLRNDNNAAFLPPFLGKAAAVAWLLPQLRRRHPDAAVIGIGDSLSDAPFMALCDFAMTPTGSQLASTLLRGEQ